MGLVGFANVAEAQVPGAADARWQAWLGCWRPVHAPLSAASAVLCIVPAPGSAVDVVTFVDAKEVSRQRHDATGERRPVDTDGCTGWESANWSSNNHRVYLRSEVTCSGGIQRVSTDVLAILPEGDLLDVQSVTAGGGAGVRVNRFRDAGVEPNAPTDISDALKDRTMAVSAARVAAGATVTPVDVVEASRLLDASVVQAFLIERGQRFRLDARQLVSLADAGVPGTVTDIMVAVSNPRVFSLDRLTGEPGLTGDSALGGAYRGAGSSYPRSRCSALGWGFDPWGFDPWAFNPYWSSYSIYGYGQVAGCGAYGYSRYSPYGYGRYGYGSWYWNRSPYVIVAQDKVTERGQAVKGRGYTRPAGSAATGTSGTSVRASGGSGSSGRSSGSGRTAKPRP